MSIQLSEAQLKSAARAATWEQIKVMYGPELEQYVSERIKSEAAKYCDDGHYHDKERDIAMLPSEHLKELQEK